jgi:ubiquinone/menaquinone biosynthesis C-methylase UbiE
MEVNVQNVIAVLEKQIAKTRQALDEADYDDASVRARVVALSQRHGGPALDVGTGACACMAVALARRGLAVTAIDHASSAVRIAQERAAGELADYLEVRRADAARLPFPDGSYRVVTAFDTLCHAPEPALVLAEMFRVCAGDGAVIITELNKDGRQVTRHHDGGFEKKLPHLLARHCQDCQQFDDAHHVTYVCEKPSGSRRMIVRR